MKSAKNLQSKQLLISDSKMTSVAAPKRQNPNEFLKQIIGRPVVVKLNSGAREMAKVIGV